MRIIDNVDPSILELRSNVIGCVVLAGLLFVVCGGLALAFVLGLIPLEYSLTPDLKSGGLAAGGLSIILGLIFVGGRSGKIFDGRRRTLTSWRGLLVPMRRNQVALESYSWVVLLKETGKGNKSSNTLFPVRLESERDPALQIAACTDALEARRLAEAVAKVLRLPMTDSTSGETVIRDADHLDESVRDRFRRLGERLEMPPQPDFVRSQIQVTSSEVVANIPGISAQARLIINAVVVVLFLGGSFACFGTQFVTGPENRWPETILEFLFPTLFVAVPIVLVLRQLSHFKRAERITANRKMLTVVQGGKTTEIPGEALEELSISGTSMEQIFQTLSDGSLVLDPALHDTPDGAKYSAEHGQPPTIPPALAGVVKALGKFAPERQSIFACSDRASVRFGGSLGSEEIHYLYAAIMKILVE